MKDISIARKIVDKQPTPPGGNFPVDGAGQLALELGAAYPFVSDRLIVRLVKAYGTEAYAVLGDAKSEHDLGRHFGWDFMNAKFSGSVSRVRADGRGCYLASNQAWATTR